MLCLVAAAAGARVGLSGVRAVPVVEGHARGACAATVSRGAFEDGSTGPAFVATARAAFDRVSHDFPLAEAGVVDSEPSDFGFGFGSEFSESTPLRRLSADPVLSGVASTELSSTSLTSSNFATSGIASSDPRRPGLTASDRATPDLVAPMAPIAGIRTDARFALIGTPWSARVESVAAIAREGVLREVPGGVRVDALAALGDEVALVGGARAQAPFGASTPEPLGDLEVRPLAGVRAAIPVGPRGGVAIDLDATPFDGGVGARAVYRTALDRGWQLELGVGVMRGLDMPWSGDADATGETRAAAWIGLRAAF